MNVSDYIKSQWKRSYNSISKKILKECDKIFISRIDVNVVIDNFFGIGGKMTAKKLKRKIREFSE